jgi:hypothetical protein
MIGVLFGVNVVNAAVPLPTDPAVVDPGPAIPADPNPPTTAPGQPTNAPQPTSGPVDQGPVTPGAGVAVGAGVEIYPPGGWTVVGHDSGMTALQKGGVVMIVGGIAWTSTPIELATQYRDAWFEGGQFTANDPQTGSVGNGVPGAAMAYTGVIENTTVDGIIVAGATGGAGVVINVFGAQGTLNGVSDDLNTVFGTVQFTGGEG